MASTTCGRCGRLAHMEAVSGLHVSRPPTGTGYIYEAVYQCPNCGRLNMAGEHLKHGAQTAASSVEAANNKNWSAPHWLPVHGETQEFPDVPHQIAEAAREASFCLSVGAYRAAGALARAVVEATAKDKGIASGNLASKIDALASAGHVREHTKEQAHEVRHFGNDLAHGDFVDAVDREDAEEVMQLVAEILDEVYQSPARLAARKAARLAKKQQQDDADT